MEGIANTRVSKQEPLSFLLQVDGFAASINAGLGAASVVGLDISQYGKASWEGLTSGAKLQFQLYKEDGTMQSYEIDTNPSSGDYDISEYVKADVKVYKNGSLWTWNSWKSVALNMKITLE